MCQDLIQSRKNSSKNQTKICWNLLQMARATRIALDLALVSIQTVRPLMSKLWFMTKSTITSTPIKPLVSNPVVTKVESAMDRATSILVVKMTELRDKQLQGELEYLQKEIEKVKRKLQDEKSCSSSKALKPPLSVIWQYAKTEMAPPMTLSIIHGKVGKNFEAVVSKTVNNFIGGLEKKIKQMDDEEQRKKDEKEAAIKAAQEKVKQAALKEAEKKKKEADKLKQKPGAAESKDKKSEKKPEVKAESQKPKKVEAKAPAKPQAKESPKKSDSKTTKAKETPKKPDPKATKK